MLNGREDNLRKYFLKSTNKKEGSPTEADTFSSNQSSEAPKSQQQIKRVRIVDRFGVILQIFASRAQSRLSLIQIELAWLAYVRTRLVRDETSMNYLSANFNKNDILETQINFRRLVETRQRNAKGSVGGEGESQLELEKRSLKNREQILKHELETLQKNQIIRRKNLQMAALKMPVIALIGYTNSGKTSIMNLLSHTNLPVDNKLFLTLSTTTRE